MISKTRTVSIRSRSHLACLSDLPSDLILSPYLSLSPDEYLEVLAQEGARLRAAAAARAAKKGGEEEDDEFDDEFEDDDDEEDEEPVYESREYKENPFETAYCRTFSHWDQAF